MLNFEILVTFRPIFEKNIHHFYGPQIIHPDAHSEKKLN